MTIDFPRTKVPCPGCGAALLACFDDGAVLGGCDSCGGMWLDTKSSRRLIAAELSGVARDFIRMIGTKGLDARTDPYRAAAPVGTRTCPACGESLATVRLTTPDLEIDVCAAHGSYMDRGEVGAIWEQAFVQAAEAHVRRADEERRMRASGRSNASLVIDGAAFLVFAGW